MIGSGVLLLPATMAGTAALLALGLAADALLLLTDVPAIARAYGTPHAD